MKSNTLGKSGLGLLLVAGALIPLAASGGDGTTYGNQAGSAMERGNQGAVRTDTMTSDPAASAEVLYPELQSIIKRWDDNERTGAYGPIRTERMDVTSSSMAASTEDLFPELRSIRQRWDEKHAGGAQGPVRNDFMEGSEPSGNAIEPSSGTSLDLTP